MSQDNVERNYCENTEEKREADRLSALARYDVLDTPSEPIFDRIAKVIQNIFDAPMAIVSLIDAHRQWYKAGIGLSAPEVPLQDTFCRHLLLNSEALVIPDAQLDERVARNPMVTGEPHIRSYAGAPLTTPDGHIIGTACAIDTKPRNFTRRETEVLADLAQLAMEALELRRQASTDHLTTSLSRRALLEAGRSLLSLAQRHGDALSVIAMDIDHFKAVNDTYGHAAGDAALKTVAETCQRGLGDADLFGRTGGEEFVALLPHASLPAAWAKAERLRASIQEIDLRHGRRGIGITASFGVACLDPSITELESLIERADAALYQAKSGGRNQTFVWAGDDRSVSSADRRALTSRGVRQRVLKAGRVVFGNGQISILCTVRTLGKDGAGIDVSNSLDIPDQFELDIASDGLMLLCRVTRRAPSHLEVSFEE